MRIRFGGPPRFSGLAGRNVVRGDTDALEVLPGLGEPGGGLMKDPIRRDDSASAGGVEGEML